MTLKKLKQMRAVRVPFQLMTTANGNSRTEHRRTSDWIPCQLVWTFSSLKNGTRDVDSHKKIWEPCTILVTADLGRGSR
jgi:hypothetical protein